MQQHNKRNICILFIIYDYLNVRGNYSLTKYKASTSTKVNMTHIRSNMILVQWVSSRLLLNLMFFLSGAGRNALIICWTVVISINLSNDITLQTWLARQNGQISSSSSENVIPYASQWLKEWRSDKCVIFWCRYCFSLRGGAILIHSLTFAMVIFGWYKPLA